MTALSLLFGPEGWGGLLLKGAVVTILLALATMPVGFGAGLALAVLKRSSNRGVRIFCEGYTTFFRGIPDLLALFIVYFGLQVLLDKLGTALSLSFHLELNAFLAGVIALGTVAAAYSSEVWVSALQAVPKGQAEAAVSLGLDRKRTFVFVVLPQLARVALPGLGNVWSILLKDTSLISTLAVMDLLRAASEASRGTRNPILFYSAAAGVYLVFSIMSNLVAVASRTPIQPRICLMGDIVHSVLGFIYNADLISTYGWRLLDGLRITVTVVGISYCLGFVLAYPLCLARASQNFFVSAAARAYITFFRGTPLLCQLYLVYYGAGEVRPFLQDIGLWVFFKEAFTCCIFAFTLNTAAYQAEIFRGALASVSRGQRETAAALGLSPFRIARHVVWPQAFLVALRPLGNELVGLIKASALAAIVTLLDLMGETRFIFARTFDFSIYLYAAIIYLAMTEAIRRVWIVIERAFSRHIVAPVERAKGATQTPVPAVATEPPLSDGVSVH